MDNQLVPHDNAIALIMDNIQNIKSMVAKAMTFDEVNKIRETAETVRTYYKLTKQSLGVQNACAEFRIRAERRIGEILFGVNLHQGGRPAKNQLHDETSSENAVRLKDLGISKSQSHRYQSLARIPENEFDSEISRIVNADDKELTTAGILDFGKSLVRNKTENIREREEEVGDEVDRQQTEDKWNDLGLHPAELIQQVRREEWRNLGEHRLFCGYPASPSFKRELPTEPSIAFSFMDLAFGTVIDVDSEWQYDSLVDYAQFAVFLIPSGELPDYMSYPSFFHNYRASLPCVFSKKNSQGIQQWAPLVILSKTEIDFDSMCKMRFLYNENKVVDGKGMSLEIFIQLLKIFSTVGQTILTPLVNNSRAVFAADKLGRKCLIVDHDEKRCSSIIASWQKETGTFVTSTEK